ncbi:MAG: PEGA domain-containing protein [Ignavibacteriales bacterium]|nr:PEGA domain-containing protein [Ignavibacteriales bacterium]
MSNKIKLGLSTIVLGSVLLLFSSCEQAVTYPDETNTGVYRTLTIDSKPSGATIFINGKNMGQKTPDSLVWLASDTNAITLRLADFRDTVFTAMAPQGVKTAIMVDFTQNPRMRGTIYCDSFPDSADIYIGDSATGLPGDYNIRYRYASCIDAVTKVKVVSEKITNNTVSMKDTTLWVTYLPENCGIPELYFNTIFVDAHDVKWLGGNSTGLTRYDELSWTNYSTSNSNIPGNIINCITEDISGNLWVGTNNGLAKLNSGSFTVYNTGNTCLTSNIITAIRVGSGDSLFVGTANSLVLFSGNTCQKLDNEFLGTMWIRSLAVSRTGLLYVCTSAGLYAYSGSTRYSLPGLTNSTVSAFAIEYNGHGWIGTIGAGDAGGTFQYTRGRIDLTSSLSNPITGDPLITFSNFTGKDIYDILLTSENYLWVSTNQGLGKCTTGSANAPVFLRVNNGFLQSNVIKAVRRDSNKYYWIATSGGGLTKYKGN